MPVDEAAGGPPRPRAEAATPSPVRLEPIAPVHAAAVQRLAADPAVLATTNLPAPYPAGGAAAWIRGLETRRGLEHAFAVVTEADGLVGVTALVLGREGAEPRLGELGYWIGRPFWGRGYATAANRLLLDAGFAGLGLRRVIARPLLRNRASCRVLEKLGFRLVATQENPFPKFHTDDLIACYEIKRWQWKRSPESSI